MAHKAKLIHTILWRGEQAFFGVYLKFMFRTTPIWHSKPPKSAFLLVGNHANRNDPFIIGVRLRTPVNYMANVEGVTGFRKFFSTGIGCFNIKKGRSDRQAFMYAMQLVKDGYSVGIFPEGDRSWLGETEEFSTAIPSLAKKMNVPVVMAKLTGHYFSRPRWSDSPRRGRIFIEFDVITQEQMNEMSKAEVYDRIAAHIKNDDFTDERLKSIKFVGKDLAVGIHNILWKCPCCQADDKIQGEGDFIVCKACGTKVQINGNQQILTQVDALKQLSIANIKDWYEWQIPILKSAVADTNAPILLQDVDVELIEEPTENEWDSKGKGTLTINHQGIEWINTDNQEKEFFELKDIMNMVDNFNVYAILNLNQKRYRLVLNNTCSLKWTRIIEILKLGV